MKSNTSQIKIAEKYLGESCPRCCSMSNNCCCYFVSKIFREAGNQKLFYGGKTVTYCPNAIKWCKANLAQIPLYIAMPSDIIFFDWELNGTPNHIGFVDHRIDDTQIHTLEGNTTSRFVVAYRTREAKYIQGIFRPEFAPTGFSKTNALVIDGKFEYNSIAMLQKALGVKQDAILGRKTVKALQKKAGATQDGSWGVKTSKAIQKMLKNDGFYTGKIDGCVYEGTVKALQKWINHKNGQKSVVQKTNVKKATAKKKVAKTPQDIMYEWAEEAIKKGYKYVNWDGSEKAKECPICHKHSKGKYYGWNCIGFVSAVLHHGLKLKTKCANNGFLGGNDSYTYLLKHSTKTAQKYVEEKAGKDFKVIKNDDKQIPTSMLKKGDIVIYYKNNEFWHIALYVGDGRIIDCSSSTGGVTKRKYKLAYPCKTAIRYTGK